MITACPFCEHMPDGATMKLCELHACKACEVRIARGFEGQCPACAQERVTNAMRFERERTAPNAEAAIDLLVRIIRVVVPLGAVAQLAEWGDRYATAIAEIRALHEVYACECKPTTWCLFCQITPHLEALP